MWLGVYSVSTPGTGFADNATVRLDLDNEPQPDAVLLVRPSHGGNVVISADDYIENSPELVVEVAASSASIDLGPKLTVYRRNGVREYLVWRVYDGAFDWFILRDTGYERLEPGADGLTRSETFPGLWLNTGRLVNGEFASVLAAVQQGIASPEHQAFVATLANRAAGAP